MKKRAGIFDPWRQAEAPPLEEPQKAVRILDPDYEDGAQAHCVQFPGVRAGINVWLASEPEDPSKTARTVLSDLIHRLYVVPEVAELLAGWHIFTGKKEEPNAVLLGEDPKFITIGSPDGGDQVVRRAVDSLALALRECVELRADAKDILTAMRVKPYVK